MLVCVCVRACDRSVLKPMVATYIRFMLQRCCGMHTPAPICHRNPSIVLGLETIIL